MVEFVLPVVFGIFIWWFATGIVLLLDGLPRRTFRWSIFISSAVAIGSFVGLAHTANQSTTVGAYCAFTCALLVWGWHELTFLTGWWQRFTQAIAAIIWHELAIIASLLLIVAITWNQSNQVGTGTFMVLWIMRTSAKLNLFFGVRNLSEEFLPEHLFYMGSYFRKRAMNPLLPISVIASSLVLYSLLQDAFEPTATAGMTVGLLLVSTMLAMAILEHLLLVLPLPSTALWRWALRKNTALPQTATFQTDSQLALLNEDLLQPRPTCDYRP
jgi:putative photosynthetic complex assembly protein 2